MNPATEPRGPMTPAQMHRPMAPAQMDPWTEDTLHCVQTALITAISNLEDAMEPMTERISKHEQQLTGLALDLRSVMQDITEIKGLVETALYENAEASIPARAEGRAEGLPVHDVEHQLVRLQEQLKTGERRL